MKKISSAILLGAIFVFINCKSNVGEAAKDDPTSKFYQAVIGLGNGFLDVFTSFGGLVADALGFKADPKKSEVKIYFDSLAQKLEETKTNLSKVPVVKADGNKAANGGDATSVNTGTSDGASGVESAIKEISEWLEAMAQAAKVAATAATGGEGDAIGNVVKADNKAANGGDETSVNGIANGIKGIVDAAGKAGEKLSATDAGKEDNADAGKLFAKKKDGGNDGGGAAKDANKAAAAVSAVSGEQIIKAIVDAAAGEGEKVAVDDVKKAKNPIAAAIGSKGEQAAAAFTEMKKDEQIAAAIVLRGMAKDGEFALTKDDHADSKGTVKNAVESAVHKTVVALTNLVRKAVQSGLGKVGAAVKSNSSKTPATATQ